MFIILAHNMLKLLASKHMHNFTPHLSCAVALFDNTIATALVHFALKSVGGFSEFLEISCTEWCYYGEPFWFNTSSPTKSTLSAICAFHISATLRITVNCVPWMYVFKQHPKTSLIPTLYFQQLLCSVSFNQIHIFNKKYGLLHWMACLQTAMTCEKVLFLLS